VTAEAVVNPNVRALPLAASDEVWANTLLSLRRTTPAEAMARYDIALQAERLARLYRAALSRLG